MANSASPNAAIIFEDNDLKMIVPDPFEADPGQTVTWVITPTGRDVELTFVGDSPFDWSTKKNTGNKIEGTVLRQAKGWYKYSVSTPGGRTIDPHIRIKP